MDRSRWQWTLRAALCAASVGCTSAPHTTPHDPGADDGASDGADSGDTGPAMPNVKVPKLHRPASSPCAQPRPPGQPGTSNPLCMGTNFNDGGPFAGDCSTDEDCDAGQNGRCNCARVGATNNSVNQCTYDGCMSDSACQNGTVCHCREDPATIRWGTQTYCLQSGNCREDSDCGPGGYCSPSPAPGCGSGTDTGDWYGYFCHTAGDECVDDGDCTEGNAYCAYVAAKARWVCVTGGCADN